MRQIWSQDDISNCNMVRGLTETGRKKHWMATDQVIKFADIKVMRNFNAPFSQIFRKDQLLADAEDRMKTFEIRQSGHTNLRQETPHGR